MSWPFHHEAGLIAHDAMHGLVEGARGRGREKRPWFTDNAEWTRIGITTRARESEDHHKRRKNTVPHWLSKANGMTMTMLFGKCCIPDQYIFRSQFSIKTPTFVISWQTSHQYFH